MSPCKKKQRTKTKQNPKIMQAKHLDSVFAVFFLWVLVRFTVVYLGKNPDFHMVMRRVQISDRLPASLCPSLLFSPSVKP